MANVEDQDQPVFSLAPSLLGRILWREKPFLGMMMGFGLLLGIAYVHLAAPVYEAGMTVAASNEQIKVGAFSGLQQGSGGLGSLIGLAGGADPDRLSPFSHYRFLLQSLTVARMLADQDQALQTVFSNLWNSKENSWVRPDSFLNPAKDLVKSILGLQPWHPPGPEELADFLASNVHIGLGTTVGVYRVTFRFRDPHAAVKLLAALHRDANEIISREELLRTNQDIDFLQRQLQFNDPVETRTAMTELLAERLETRTILSENFDYGARIIEPVFVSKDPVSPNPKMVLPAAMLVFLLLGSCTVLYIFARSIRLGNAYRPGILSALGRQMMRIFRR